jgi:hypothetical protein
MQNFVEKVLEALTQAGVEFVVVGGAPARAPDRDEASGRTREGPRRAPIARGHVGGDVAPALSRI